MCYRCLAIVLISQMTVSAQARQAVPPEITIVQQDRVVALGLGAEGDPLDSDLTVESIAPDNGPFIAQFIDSVSANLGTSASGDVFQDSTITAFKIAGEGDTEGTSSGGANMSVGGVSAFSSISIRFTVPVDATFSLSGSLEASSSGTGTVLGQSILTVSGTDPGGAPFNINAFANGAISSDPVPFFHTQEVMAGTEVIFSITAQTLTGDVGASTSSAAAKFNFSLDFGDEDGDGLLDVWETDGIDIDDDGTLEIDLPGMGANPMKKDIFVELDAMSGIGVDMVAINDVIGAFALAPASMIDNPDGSTGITLHVIVDETNLANQALTGTDWPGAFDTLKQSHFGSPSDRARPDWIDLKKAREKIFRYCLWGNTLVLDGTAITGVGERPGNDFIVAAGFTATTFSNDTTAALSGTFMHELGHTLGLSHGGTDGVNFKPNYISVMNYTYQAPFTGSESAWFLDYSRNFLLSLDETSLFESFGLDGPSSKSVMFNSAPNGQPPVRTIVYADASPVDWNQDSTIDPSVAQDINRLLPSSAASPGETLHSSVDWNHLWYSLSGSVNFEDGIGRNLATIEVEMNEAEILEMHATVVVDLTACPADTDDSGTVDVGDLIDLLADWGVPCGATCPSDITGDGFVDVLDLIVLLADWGVCP